MLKVIIPLKMFLLLYEYLKNKLLLLDVGKEQLITRVKTYLSRKSKRPVEEVFMERAFIT